MAANEPTKLILDRKYPNCSIVMLGSQYQLKYFDENGKGFDEMTGWHLCDGRNGAPDLRDRVVYGGNSNDIIGTHGDNNHIQLTVDHMPSHNHIGFINLF